MATGKENPDKDKKKYTKKQQAAIQQSVKAIKEVYGQDIDSKTLNNILGNIEVETGWNDLREKSYSWKGLKENTDLVSANKNVAKWGKGKDVYEKLTPKEKLSVMYFGDTDHQHVAGGRGVLQLTSSNYGGNGDTATDIKKASEELGIDTSTLSDDFYNSTLLTLQVFKNRGVDFGDYSSAKDARQQLINPSQDYEKLSAEKKAALANEDWSLPASEEAIASGSSIDPRLIENSPNLDAQAKDELYRLNEEAGLQPETLKQLAPKGSSPFSDLLNSTSNNILAPTNDIVNQEMGLRSKLPPLEPIVDVTKQKPKSQEQKPVQQQSSTDFLQDYLNNNQFAMGGKTKQNQYAMGGITEGQDPQSEGGMTQIPGSAGTHDQNPNGGVQIGMGENGLPNTGEGGETMSNNYVYSDKLTLDETIIQKVGLDKKFKGKTIAEVSKIIEKNKTEQPNDKVVADTADENLDKLKNANEILRLSQELLSPEPEQAQGQNQAQFGLPHGMQIGTDKYGNKATDLMTSGIDAGGYLGMAKTGMELGATAFSKKKIDKTGQTDQATPGIADNVAGDTMKGAKAGMAAGPWGAAAGAVIGAGASLIGGAKNKQARAKERGIYDLAQGVPSNQYFLGGGGGGGTQGYGQDMGMNSLFGNDKMTTTGQGAAGHNVNADGRSTADIMGKTGENSIGAAKGIAGKAFPMFAGIGEGAKAGGNAIFGENTTGSGIVDGIFDPASAQMGIISKDSGASTSDKIGAFLNPIGAGVIAGRLKKEKQAKENMQNDVNANRLAGQFEFGGHTDAPKQNKLANGGIGGGLNNFDPNYMYNSIDALGGGKPLPFAGSQNFLQKPEDTITPFTNENTLSDKVDSYGTELQSTQPQGREADGWWDRNKSGLGDKGADAMRYAPVAMSAFQLATQKKPDVERLDRLDSRYKPNYMDERALQNIADSNFNNIANSLAGASGGSGSTLRNNLLAAHLQKNKGISDAYMKSKQFNASQDNAAQQFNLGVDRGNLSQSNLEKNMNAANKGAVESNKQKLLSQIGMDVGNIGLEQTRKKYPERLGLLYDYLGKFTG